MTQKQKKYYVHYREEMDKTAKVWADSKEEAVQKLKVGMDGVDFEVIEEYEDTTKIDVDSVEETTTITGKSSA